MIITKQPNRQSMSSIENKRVMIACVTFETYKIVNPAKYYNVDKIYLVHYVYKGNHDIVYYKFFQRTCDLLREEIKGVEIIDSEEIYGSTPVYDFNTMLKVVLNIIDREKNNHVYVNISAGTAEYSAASAIAAMMNEGIAYPFSVNTKKFTVENDRIEELYFGDIDGKRVPIGLTLDTKDPVDFMSYKIHMPKDDKMVALKILYKHWEENKTNDHGMKSADIIRRMKELKIWPDFDREQKKKEQEERDRNGKGKEKNTNSEAVYFYRLYAKKWIEQGWAEQLDNKRYRITDRGRNDVEVFLYEGLDQD